MFADIPRSAFHYRQPVVWAGAWTARLGLLLPDVRLGLALEFLDAVRIAESVGCFGFQSTPPLSSEGPFSLREFRGELGSELRVVVRTARLGPFDADARRPAERRETSAWAASWAEAIAGPGVWARGLSAPHGALAHPSSGGALHIPDGPLDPFQAFSAAMAALMSDDISVASGGVVYAAFARGEGRALVEMFRQGVCPEVAATLFDAAHPIRMRAADRFAASEGARDGTRSPPLLDFEMGGFSPDPLERRVALALKRRTENDLSAVILDDGSIVANTGVMLGHGKYRHAKEAIFVREEQGALQVRRVCKLSGHASSPKLWFKDKRDGRRYALRATDFQARCDEDLAQRTLAAAGAQHVLLPLAAYRRDTWDGVRDTQLFPLAGQDLETAIRQRRHLDPEARFSELLPSLTSAARGLVEMHALGFRHNDFKPANIVLSGARAQLGDLGFASSAHAQVLRGTLCYMPPVFSVAPSEWSRRPTVSPATDVHALGATLLEAWYGSSHVLEPSIAPRGENYREQDYQWAFWGAASRVRSEPVRSLILSLLRSDDAARPTAAEAAAALEALPARVSGP